MISICRERGEKEEGAEGSYKEGRRGRKASRKKGANYDSRTLASLFALPHAANVSLNGKFFGIGIWDTAGQAEYVCFYYSVTVVTLPPVIDCNFVTVAVTVMWYCQSHGRCQRSLCYDVRVSDCGERG